MKTSCLFVPLEFYCKFVYHVNSLLCLLNFLIKLHNLKIAIVVAINKLDEQIQNKSAVHYIFHIIYVLARSLKELIIVIRFVTGLSHIFFMYF